MACVEISSQAFGDISRCFYWDPGTCPALFHSTTAAILSQIMLFSQPICFLCLILTREWAQRSRTTHNVKFANISSAFWLGFLHLCPCVSSSFSRCTASSCSALICCEFLIWTGPTPTYLTLVWRSALLDGPELFVLSAPRCAYVCVSDTQLTVGLSGSALRQRPEAHFSGVYLSARSLCSAAPQPPSCFWMTGVRLATQRGHSILVHTSTSRGNLPQNQHHFSLLSSGAVCWEVKNDHLFWNWIHRTFWHLNSPESQAIKTFFLVWSGWLDYTKKVFSF